MKNFFHFNFLPVSRDFGLFVLRAWLGLSMLLLHGVAKIDKLQKAPVVFADPFGIGPKASLALATFAEVVAALMLVFGLFTRFAALSLIVTMAVAFWTAHGGRLTGQGNGELAFLYLGGFVVILLAGAGKISVDSHIGAKE